MRRRARVPGAAARAREFRRMRPRRRRFRSADRRQRTAIDAGEQGAAGVVAGDGEELRGRRIRHCGARPGTTDRPRLHQPVRHRSEESRAAALAGRRRDLALAAARERARRVSLHRRRISLQARERGPDPHVRRGRRRLPHQSAISPPVGRNAGETTVDRLRLGHALRLGSRRASGHLRQGRQFGRVDRHARRHEGALCRFRSLRSDDVGVDDHQRTGADDAGDVLQHRHRSAASTPSARNTDASRARRK